MTRLNAGGLLRGWSLAVLVAGAMFCCASAAWSAEESKKQPEGVATWNGTIVPDQASIVLGIEVLTTAKKGEPVTVIAREGGWLGVVYVERGGVAGQSGRKVRGWIVAKDVAGGPPELAKDNAGEPGPPPDWLPAEFVTEKMPVALAWKGTKISGLVDDIPDFTCTRAQGANVNEAQIVAELIVVPSDEAKLGDIGVLKAGRLLAMMSGGAARPGATGVLKVDVPQSGGRMSAEVCFVQVVKSEDGSVQVRMRFSPPVALKANSTVVNGKDWSAAMSALMMARDRLGVAFPDGELRVALFKPRDPKAAEPAAGERLSNWLTFAVWVVEPTPEQGMTRFMDDTSYLMTRGRYQEAVNMFRAGLAADPKNTSILYNAACAYCRLGDKPKAVAFLKDAVTAGWTDFEYILDDVDLDGIRGEPGYQEAVKAACTRTIAEYRKVLAANPKNALALYCIARAFSASGDKAQAASVLRLAVDAGWDDFDRMEEDAALEGVRGQKGYEESLKQAWRNNLTAADKLMAADSKSITIPLKAARACSLLGEKAKAIALLKKAVDAGLGKYEYLEQNPALQAVRGEPAFKELLAAVRKATCLKRIEQLQKAPAAKPEDVMNSLYEPARLYSVLGDTSNALVFLKKAVDAGFSDFYRIEGNGDFDAIRGEAAYKENLQRACRAALEAFGKTPTGHPDYPLTLRKSKLACLILGDREKADAFQKKMEDACRSVIDANQKVLAAQPGNAGALYANARAWALLGDKENACALLEEAAAAGWYGTIIYDWPFYTCAMAKDDALDGVRAQSGYARAYRRACLNGVNYPLKIGHPYSAACIYSLLGDKTRALAYLKMAVDDGHGLDLAQDDRDFDAIHYEREFELLLRAQGQTLR